MLDLSTSTPSLGLAGLFPGAGSEALLGEAPALGEEQPHSLPEEGPALTVDQAYLLRAAAIDACELIVQTAKEMDTSDATEDLSWLKGMTLPEIDAWIWAVAKDRPDYRKLERFALRNTAYF